MRALVNQSFRFKGHIKAAGDEITELDLIRKFILNQEQRLVNFISENQHAKI